MNRELTVLIVACVFMVALAWFAYSYQRCAIGPCLLDDLREWQDLISGGLTIVAAFIGGAYVVRTSNRQLRALTNQFRETVRPFVVVRLGTRAGVVFMLTVENIGRSMAYRVRLELDRDFHPFAERQSLRELPAFMKEIPQFAPGETLSFNLSQGFNMTNVKDGKDLTPRQFVVTASYEFEGTVYRDRFSIDVEHYFGSAAHRPTQDHIEDIAKHLKNIADKMR